MNLYPFKLPVGTRLVGLSLMLLILLLVNSSNSFAGFLHGYVYTRNVVVNAAGNYTWGEYNTSTGAYVRDIGEASGDLDPKKWRVMSSDEYRSIVQQKQDLHKAQPDLLLISRSAYEGGSILLADGSAMTKPALAQTTAYVSVIPQLRRFINDPASLIIAEYPINPDIAIGADIVSLLHQFKDSGVGQTRNASTNRIGFKAVFAKDKAGNPVPISENFKISGSNEYEAVGPIGNAVIEGWQSGSVSGNTGNFQLYSYDVPCPGFSYVIDSPISVELRYRRFNPKSSGHTGLYLDLYPSSVTCNSSYFMVPILGPFPLGWEFHSFPTGPIQFAIDLSVLSGTAQLSADIVTQNNRVKLSANKVPVADTTRYQAATPDNSLTETSGYDFDRDGTLDTILKGHIETDAQGNKVFASAAPDELQGVWLSSSGITPQTGQPNFTRVMDSASFKDHTNQGLLSQIGAEDLRNTDIYVVRVSDGKLISERIGLNEYEANRISAFGEDRAASQFFYTIQMQGSTGDKRFSLNYFDDWQSASGINPDLHQRKSDHLQPGDVIRIYAINRATGYIGHTDTVMKGAGQEIGGDLSFHIDPIVMGPPNLRIRAERGYKIDKGASASKDTITQLIGFEGASLTSDKTVTITTEWLDHDGRPISESLAGAGYTGRIAILSGNKTLPSDNQGVYQFSIDPGRRIQVIQLPNALTDNEHFYIHVSGEPKSGNPLFAGSTDNVRLGEADFSSTGQNPGILAKRPDHYVPFLVPIFDEAATELQTQAYRLLKKADPVTFGEAPEPIYRWVYRPEMQFSSYDFKVNKINRSQDADANGTISADETIDVLNQSEPDISSNSVIEILYGLSTTDLLPLDFFNAGLEKQLVFVVGEQEVKATLGAGQTIKFDDLSHLELLNPDEFLTIGLYANNDMGNSLWQLDFQKVIPMSADFNRDGKIIFSQQVTENGIRSDLNTSEKPYVFWINNDDDKPNDETAGYDITAKSGWFEFDGHDPDFENAKIDGSRDLIDFFAVGIDIHDFLTKTENSENFTYLLLHDDAAVNVVYTVMSRGEDAGSGLSSDYLNKINMIDVKPVFGDWQSNGLLAEVPVYKVTVEGIQIPTEFIQLIKNDKNKGVILVEGNKQTAKPLKIKIKDAKNTLVAIGSLPLHIYDVTKLYRQASLRGSSRDELSSKWGASPTGIAPDVADLLAGLSSQSTAIEPIYPELDRSRHVIHVHGFNNDEGAASAFQAETFKRLFHAGSNVLFTGVHWHGDEGVPAAVNYWDNVENAFYAADDLAALVNGISGNKTIIAHSLGNMIVGSAIQDFAMGFDKYMMLNPAVALEAYELVSQPALMRNVDWDKFYFGADYSATLDTETYTDQLGRRLWSVEWHTLFPATDERHKLTWRGRFSTVSSSANVIQYYSTGEEVLQAPVTAEFSSLDPVTDSGRNAWNIQEKAKGTHSIAGLAGGGSSAGWGFNTTCEKNMIDPLQQEVCYSNALHTHTNAEVFYNKTSQELIQTPFFDPFDNAQLSNPNATESEIIQSFPHDLGYEIPALSYAAGGTKIPSFLAANAVNMNNQMSDGWPAERGGLAWRHSDFKDIAYRYTYKLFDNLVTKGALK